MKQKVIKIGSSVGVTIPKESLEKLGVGVGDTVETDVSHGSFVVRPEQRKEVIDPQVIQWTDEFIEKNRTLLERLKDK